MSPPECLFCRIASGEIEAKVVLERDDLLAFRDVSPQAPVHLLIIPREHVESLQALEERHAGLAGQILLVASELAAREGLAERGWRLVLNTGADGGQTVFHMHAHLLGGRSMGWPPG